MTIGASILLIAIGGILAFAVTASVAGISLSTAGYILMAAGGLGLLIGIVGIAGGGDRTTERRTTVER